MDAQGEEHGGRGVVETYSSPRDWKDWWVLPLRKRTGTSQLLNLEGLFLVASRPGIQDCKQGEETTERQITMQSPERERAVPMSP